MTKKDIEILKGVIREAVSAGQKAKRSTLDNIYKETERRLYALPILRRRVAEGKEELDEIKQKGIPETSKSLVRYRRGGVRLSPEEMLEAIVHNMEAEIAADEHEIQAIENALLKISKDSYYCCVEGRYIKGLTDSEISEKIFCETTTVYRNRKRLINMLAVWLYGSNALQ